MTRWRGCRASVRCSSIGARDYGMRIWLDPGKMARLGVTAGDITSVISEQNVVAPAGIVGAEPAPPGQQMTYTVTVHGGYGACRNSRTWC